MRRRVAVTGIGVLTALGEGRADTWKGLLDGRCGIGPIRAYDASSLRTRIAAELEGFAPERYATRRELRMTTHGDRLAIAGAALAMTDAGLSPGTTPYAPERSAVYAGGGKEISNPEHLLEGSLAARAEDGSADFALLGERATSAFHPLYYVEGLQSASLFHLSHAHGFKGANAYFHGAADSGATAVGRGYRSIARGESDVVLAGGFDDAASWWVMSKMDGLGLLSTRNYAPDEAYRPFGRDRDGSVPGEGAAFLVLEELTAARSRGATVIAEIRAFAATRAGGRLHGPDA
ncbi:beta-ketoacyl synthase N-terminal-like domain-containing protein, partial [Streptomyces sp. T-3]|nr:beta-ketoacyl synthase N-terminal-like domain-containing protein [Streptomyces sp. T-3]